MAQIIFTYLSFDFGGKMVSTRPGDQKPNNSFCIREQVSAGLNESKSRSKDLFSTCRRVNNAAHQTTSVHIGDHSVAFMVANLTPHRGKITVFWQRGTDMIRFAQAGSHTECTDEYEIPVIPATMTKPDEIVRFISDFYGDCIRGQRPQLLPRGAHTFDGKPGNASGVAASP